MTARKMSAQNYRLYWKCREENSMKVTFEGIGDSCSCLLPSLAMFLFGMERYRAPSCQLDRARIMWSNKMANNSAVPLLDKRYLNA